MTASEGSFEGRVRQLELENDMLRVVARDKGREPQHDDEQGEGPGHRRSENDDGEEPETVRRFLEDIEELLRAPARGAGEAGERESPASEQLEGFRLVARRVIEASLELADEPEAA